MRISYEENSKPRILAYLKEQKNKPFTVIDVGGTVHGWTSEVVDAVVDMNATRPSDFKINISNENEWQPVLSYVAEHGKFDYAVCTHTIEDISNPSLLLRMLPRIAKAGVVSAPSPRTELSRVESSNWLGYIHHRHIIGWKNNAILIVPKLVVLESIAGDGLPYDSSKFEIVVEWEDTLPFSMFMDDYLGPNPSAVIDSYQRFIAHVAECC